MDNIKADSMDEYVRRIEAKLAVVVRQNHEVETALRGQVTALLGALRHVADALGRDTSPAALEELRGVLDQFLGAAAN
jgi:hypothetical protein